MQMTVMSEGFLLNSKYIKMGREEGGFQALLTQLPLVIVCHELIIWRLPFTVLRWSEMSVQYAMSSRVGNLVTKVQSDEPPSRLLYIMLLLPY